MEITIIQLLKLMLKGTRENKTKEVGELLEKLLDNINKDSVLHTVKITYNS